MSSFRDLPTQNTVEKNLGHSKLLIFSVTQNIVTQNRWPKTLAAHAPSWAHSLHCWLFSHEQRHSIMIVVVAIEMVLLVVLVFVVLYFTLKNLRLTTTIDGICAGHEIVLLTVDDLVRFHEFEVLMHVASGRFAGSNRAEFRAVLCSSQRTTERTKGQNGACSALCYLGTAKRTNKSRKRRCSPWYAGKRKIPLLKRTLG